MHEREIEIARRDEDEKKRSHDEFSSHERKIGGDGRGREKRKEERKRGGE